jgi:archaellum component FlaC
MTDLTIQELKDEVERLKQVVKELTEAVKVLTEKETRAQAFIVRVEELLK